MGRNNDRLSSAPPALIGQQENDDFFTIPVSLNVVRLPTEGRFYSENHPFYRKETIEMREMTTKHEEILANQQLVKQGKALDKVISDLFVDDGVKLDDLFIVDKNAIILDVMKNNYDSVYRVPIVCPVCSDKRVEEIDLNNLDIKPLPDDLSIPEESRVSVDVDGSFSISIHNKSGDDVATISVRLLKGLDEKSLKMEEEKKKKHNVPHHPLQSLLQKIIVDVRGDDDAHHIEKFVENLPAFYSKQIMKEYNRLVPNVDLTHRYVCQNENCQAETMVEIPLNAQFFRSNQ